VEGNGFFPETCILFEYLMACKTHKHHSWTAYSSKGNENALEVSEKVLRKSEMFQLAWKL